MSHSNSKIGDKIRVSIRFRPPTSEEAHNESIIWKYDDRCVTPCEPRVILSSDVLLPSNPDAVAGTSPKPSKDTLRRHAKTLSSASGTWLNAEESHVKPVEKIRPALPAGFKNSIRKSSPAIPAAGPSRVPSGGFQYDRVFGMEIETRTLYDEVAKDIIENVMLGFNGTIFAYGQTSSGKTYTISGTEGDPGIISLAVQDIFSYIQANPEREFFIRVSYLEIYNEQINSLLSYDRKDLKIREDPEAGVYVDGADERVVQSEEDVMAVLREGTANRHISATKFNDFSSRSHAIFQMCIESRDLAAPQGQGVSVRVSVLNLVDLAGSEKLWSNEDEKLRETTSINKSLFVLGKVILKLSEGSGSHVPYREGKLTRILEPALGGNSLTCIICTVTPVSSQFEETLSTLKFASRAKKIQNVAHINEYMDDKAQLNRYRGEINKLKEQLIAETEQMRDLQVDKEKMAYDNTLMEMRLREEREVRKQLESTKRELEMKIAELSNLLIVSGGHQQVGARPSTLTSLSRRSLHGAGESLSDSEVTSERSLADEPVDVPRRHACKSRFGFGWRSYGWSGHRRHASTSSTRSRDAFPFDNTPHDVDDSLENETRSTLDGLSGRSSPVVASAHDADPVASLSHRVRDLESSLEAAQASERLAMRRLQDTESRCRTLEQMLFQANHKMASLETELLVKTAEAQKQAAAAQEYQCDAALAAAKMQGLEAQLQAAASAQVSTEAKLHATEAKLMSCEADLASARAQRDVAITTAGSPSDWSAHDPSHAALLHPSQSSFPDAPSAARRRDYLDQVPLLAPHASLTIVPPPGSGAASTTGGALLSSSSFTGVATSSTADLGTSPNACSSTAALGPTATSRPPSTTAAPMPLPTPESTLDVSSGGSWAWQEEQSSLKHVVSGVSATVAEALNYVRFLAASDHPLPSHS